jgi:hypothetical protein
LLDTPGVGTRQACKHLPGEGLMLLKILKVLGLQKKPLMPKNSLPTVHFIHSSQYLANEPIQFQRDQLKSKPLARLNYIIETWIRDNTMHANNWLCKSSRQTA